MLERLGAHEIDGDDEVGAVLEDRCGRHGHERETVDETVSVALLRREDTRDRERREERFPQRPVTDILTWPGDPKSGWV